LNFGGIFEASVDSALLFNVSSGLLVTGNLQLEHNELLQSLRNKKALINLICPSLTRSDDE